MSGRASFNPYILPPKYTHQLLRKEGKREGSGPADYWDWKKWNLARDGTKVRLSGGKSSMTRRKSVGGDAVRDGVMKKSKRASTMAEVEGRLLAKAAEYAAPPVRLGQEAEEVVQEQEEVEEEEKMEEVEEEGEYGEELEVTAQLQRESGVGPLLEEERQLEYEPGIAREARVAEEGVLRGRPSKERDRKSVV